MSEPVPVAVPTLAEVLADRGILDRLAVNVLLDLRRQVGYLGVDLDMAIIDRQTRPARGQPAPSELDRLLTAEEAAPLVGVTPSWLIRRAKRLPFARKLSHKVIRFSEAGLRRWLATRRP